MDVEVDAGHEALDPGAQVAIPAVNVSVCVSGAEKSVFQVTFPLDGSGKAEVGRRDMEDGWWTRGLMGLVMVAWWWRWWRRLLYLVVAGVLLYLEGSLW